MLAIIQITPTSFFFFSMVSFRKFVGKSFGARRNKLKIFDEGKDVILSIANWFRNFEPIYVFKFIHFVVANNDIIINSWEQTSRVRNLFEFL